MLAKEKIEEILKSLYNREHWKNMLTGMFEDANVQINWEIKPVEIALGSKTVAYRAKNLYRLGAIKLADDKLINIYEAEVQNTHIAQNRVGLRNLVRSEIIPGFNDAAIAVFHSSEQTEWRFTFMSKWEFPEDSGKVVKHETHPKKFTYVLGPSESSRTARDRFYELQAKTKTLQYLMEAFSVAKLSKEFFEEYREHYKAFYDYLKNSSYRTAVFKIRKQKTEAENEQAEKPMRDFVKRLLGRIVFLYFLQKKGWMHSIWIKNNEIKPDNAFMKNLFENRDKKKDFYSTYLTPLFFYTLNKERKNDLFKINNQTLGTIPYLNGGLFEKDFDEAEEIKFKNDLFDNLFEFFNSYNFTIIEDSPDEREVAVDPEMLGHIFENLIEENKKFGTFYTPKEVVHFMTQEALLLHLTKKLSLQHDSDEWKALKRFVQNKEPHSFITQYALQIDAELDALKVCDPAIGSGAFPMGILLEIYQLKLHLYALANSGTDFSPSKIKEQIIRNSIYGVDIDKGAIDIARLRFWLSLIVDLPVPRPLPNFDYKFMQGDSLKEEFEGVSLKFDVKRYETKLITQTDLFGKPVNAQISITDFIQSGGFTEEFDVLNLEDKLFNTYDIAEKQKIRKQLLQLEKKVLQYNINKQKDDAEQRLKNLKDELKNKSVSISDVQKKQLTAQYEKKFQKAEQEIELVYDRAQRLKELDVYEKPYFLWHLYFKHVFDKGGFDIVIANPPYGVKVDDDLYNQSNLGSKDSYGFFIKLAIETLLKPNGTLVYIVSDTWLTIKTHFELRQLVLKKQLHKVVRLHPDTFGAVVNTCIIALTNANKLKGDETVLAADLTNLSTKKALPEFREKLWHLENFVSEFNERYAIYSYPQQLINTNSSLPIFTASPKLFALMNDTTCKKEKRKLNDVVESSLSVDEEKDNKKVEIEIRKINVNGKEVELVRFGDVAEVKVGLQTGDNNYYLYQNPEVRGNYDSILEHQNFLLTEEDLQKIHDNEIIRLKVIEKGIHQSKDERVFDKERWFGGRFIIPYDKGGESDTDEGWLPNYYVPGDYFIKWDTKSANALINQKKIRKSSSSSYPRNKNYYFKLGITYSRTGNYSPTFRIGQGGVFDDKSCTLFLKEIDINYTLGICSSRLLKFMFKNFLGHTVDAQIDDLKEIPFYNSNSSKISVLVEKVISKQVETKHYSFLLNEQKEIDSLVYELYGLNEEDIQEVEYWWARRYPKLARFADTKPRLAIKDKQEQLARLQEMIARGENKYCEFKSSLRLDIRKGTPEKVIEHSAFKNIAGFLNSEGGTLIIGVDDAKQILGLEATDYTTFSKPDKQDEWSKHLDNLMQNFIGNKMHHFVKTQFIQTDETKTIALIEVQPSTEPVWLKNGNTEEFYIRRTASAIQLSAKEANEYIIAHWKK